MLGTILVTRNSKSQRAGTGVFDPNQFQKRRNVGFMKIVAADIFTKIVPVSKFKAAMDLLRVKSE